MINVKVKLFGYVKELGESTILLTIEKGSTVNDVFKALKARSLKERKDFIDELGTEGYPFNFVVNNTFVDEKFQLKDGDLLYIMPPIGGG